MSCGMLHRNIVRILPRQSGLVSLVACAIALTACAAPSADPSASGTALEQIHLLRSIREQLTPVLGWCSRSRTGFEPLPTDAERYFSFWTIQSHPEDGRVVDATHARVAELRACMGPTQERTRQNFYAEVQFGGMSFRGHGECLAVMTDFPELGLFPVACRLILSGLPVPFIGGLLTTNTMSSHSAFGAITEPPGYMQASIATIRLWKVKVSP